MVSGSDWALISTNGTRTAVSSTMAVHGIQTLASDTEGLGFGGAGDGTAVVVGEHDDGSALQGWIKRPLGRGVETVHIHMRDLRHMPHHRWLRHDRL